LAGNVTVTNVSFILDYSSKTNPPVIKPDWPRNGTRISGGSFTARGWVNDPTASVKAQIVGGGVTNLVSGRVGRDGDFWIENVPLAAGTNLLTLTATDVVSNSVTTNLSVTKSDLSLTITSTALGGTASGGLSDTNYTVWINGVRATNQAGNTWIAAYAGLNLGQSSVQVRAIPNTDNGGNGSGSPAAEDQGNPSSAQAVDAETELVWPAGQIYANPLHLADDYVTWETNGEALNLWHYDVGWDESAGGSDFEQWGAWPITTNIAHDVWEPGSWPHAEGIEEVAWYSLGAFWTNAITGWPQPTHYYFGELEYDAYGGLLTAHYRDEMQLIMVTGGGAGSTGIELYGITGAGTAIGPPGPPDYGHYETASGIPPEQITVGNLGSFDTNGFLLAALPPRTKVNVTPRKAGVSYFSMSIGGQLYLLNWRAVSLTPTNRARTTIGVGEEVEFYFSPPTLPVKVDWSTTAGSVWPTNEVYTKFTAPSNAATATVTLTYGRTVTNVTFNVVEPTGVASAKITSTTGLYIPPSAAGAWMRLNVTLGPTNVSFYRVQIWEPGHDAINTNGYFVAHTPLPHGNRQGANKWRPVSYANLVDQGDNFDTCSYSGSAYLPSPWSTGSFTWPINPASWRIPGGQTNSLPWSDQVFSLTSAGTLTISKFGTNVTRTVNNVITPQLP
jgi:hypothetical protein